MEFKFVGKRLNNSQDHLEINLASDIAEHNSEQKWSWSILTIPNRDAEKREAQA